MIQAWLEALEATALARITSADPHAGLPEPGELIEGLPDLDLADPTGHQLAPEEKRRRADVVIANDGGEPDLRRKLLAWLASAGSSEIFCTTSIPSLTRPKIVNCPASAG